MRTLPRLLSGLALCGTAALATSIDAADAPVQERYIPVELWAGAEWNGTRELKMPKVNATYRHRQAYQYCPGKSMVSQIQHR